MRIVLVGALLGYGSGLAYFAWPPPPPDATPASSTAIAWPADAPAAPGEPIDLSARTAAGEAPWSDVLFALTAPRVRRRELEACRVGLVDPPTAACNVVWTLSLRREGDAATVVRADGEVQPADPGCVALATCLARRLVGRALPAPSSAPERFAATYRTTSPPDAPRDPDLLRGRLELYRADLRGAREAGLDRNPTPDLAYRLRLSEDLVRDLEEQLAEAPR